jgi:hypothetical protein
MYVMKSHMIEFAPHLVMICNGSLCARWLRSDFSEFANRTLRQSSSENSIKYRHLPRQSRQAVIAGHDPVNHHPPEGRRHFPEFCPLRVHKRLCDNR